MLRPMVKYGPADSSSLCGQHIWENETLVRPPRQQPRLWVSGSASQASDQRWRRPRVQLLRRLHIHELSANLTSVPCIQTLFFFTAKFTLLLYQFQFWSLQVLMFYIISFSSVLQYKFTFLGCNSTFLEFSKTLNGQWSGIILSSVWSSNNFFSGVYRNLSEILGTLKKD